jgi:hypothetical protein
MTATLFEQWGRLIGERRKYGAREGNKQRYWHCAFDRDSPFPLSRHLGSRWTPATSVKAPSETAN